MRENKVFFSLAYFFCMFIFVWKNLSYDFISIEDSLIARQSGRIIFYFWSGCLYNHWNYRYFQRNDDDVVVSWFFMWIASFNLFFFLCCVSRLGGLLGALYTWLNVKINLFRKANINKRSVYRVVEVRFSFSYSFSFSTSVFPPRVFFLCQCITVELDAKEMLCFLVCFLVFFFFFLRY